jgi:hypothetical protein
MVAATAPARILLRLLVVPPSREDRLLELAGNAATGCRGGGSRGARARAARPGDPRGGYGASRGSRRRPKIRTRGGTRSRRRSPRRRRRSRISRRRSLKAALSPRWCKPSAIRNDGIRRSARSGPISISRALCRSASGTSRRSCRRRPRSGRGYYGSTRAAFAGPPFELVSVNIRIAELRSPQGSVMASRYP